MGIISHLASLTSLSPNSIETETITNLNSPYFDQVRVLPVYRHMFSDKRDNQASYEDRLKLCNLAFSDLSNVIVSDDERRCFEWAAAKKGLHEEKDLKELRVGTADLLDMLIEAQNGSHMEDEFTFSLGSDAFLDLTNWKWRRSKDIFKLINFRILVIQRLSPSSNSSTQDEDLVSESVLKQRIEEVYSQMADEGIKVERNIFVTRCTSLSAVSSSSVRSSNDDRYLSKVLNSSVFHHIKKNKMYGYASS